MKVTEDISNSKVAKRIFWLSWLAYSCSYFGRHNFSAAVAGIVAQGIYTKSQIGIVGTVFFVVYGLGQLVNGFMGDKFSPYKMIILGTFVSSLANLLMCFANSLAAMAVVWGINGFAQSMLWSPIIFIISNMLNGKKLVRAESLLSATIPAGTLAAYLSSTVIMRFFAWRYVFAAGSVVLMCVCVAWMVCYLTTDKASRQIKHQRIATADGKKAPFFKAAAASGLVFMAMPVMLHATLKDGAMTWVPTMISELFEVTPSFSVLLTLVLPIVNFFGAIIANRINAKGKLSELRNACIFFSFALLPLGGLMFINRLTPFASVLLLAFITSSMFAINHIFLTLVPVSFARLGRAATMAGLLDFTAYAGSAISSYGFGALAQTIGWNNTITVWLAVAFSALMFCLLAIRRWEKFKSQYE